jgi:hypothetical protein
MKTRNVCSLGALLVLALGLSLASEANAFTGYVNLSSDAGRGDNLLSSQSPVTFGTENFLAGVYGSFGEWTLADSWAISNVDFFPGMGQWWAITGTRSPQPFSLSAYSWAVYPGDGTLAPQGCGPHSPEVSLPAPSGAVRWGCYLVGLSNESYFAYSQWNDEARVVWDGTRGVNGGRGNATLQCSGNAEAQAQCVPITYLYESAWGGWSGGPTMTDLGPQDWTNGKICLLSGIWGTFRTNGAGVGAYFSGSGDWYLATATGVGAFVDCVE